MPPLAYHPADAGMVRQILSQTGVATRPEGPTLTSYLGALIEALLRWISGRPGLTSGILYAGFAIAIVTVAFALTLAVLSLIGRLRFGGTRRISAPPVRGTQIPEDAPTMRDPFAWRAEIEARLSRGDIAGALEALWWWLASSLPLESGADASWTTRELLLNARRRELLNLGGTLDVLMYGPRAPLPEDVTACLARLEERLA